METHKERIYAMWLTKFMSKRKRKRKRTFQIRAI